MSLHIQLEFPLSDSERASLRAMLDALQGAGVGHAPLPLIPAVPSTAGATLLPTAPVVSSGGVPGTYPSGASGLAQQPGPADSAGEQATSAFPVTNPAGIVVDKRGIPWDERIHSSSKTCTANGEWRRRKGLNDEALEKRITAELLATMQVPVQPVTNVAAAMGQTAPTLPAGATPLPNPASMAAAGAPVLPAGATPLPTMAGVLTTGALPTPSDPTDLNSLMHRLTAGITNGVITQADIDGMMQAFQIPNAYGLVKRPELLPQIWAAMKSNFPAL